MEQMDYSEIILEVFKLKGIDILLDRRLFAACITDLGGTRYKMETGLIARNLDEPTLKILYDAANDVSLPLDDARARVTAVLHNEMGITIEISTKIAYDLAYAVETYCGRDDLSAWGDIEAALMKPAPSPGAETSLPRTADAEQSFARNTIEEDAASFAVELVSYGNNKIAAIKVHREQTGSSLAEAKRAIEAAPTVLMQSEDKAGCERFVVELNNVGATARLQQRASTNERSIQSIAPRHLNVVLEAFGGDKINVIKALRGQTGLSLAEAKYVVESSPCTIRSTTDEKKCGAIVEALRAAGASVHVESSEERCCAYYDNPSTTEDRAKAFAATIPILMKYLRLSYGDAEKIMDSAPCGVVRCISKSLADNMVSEIHAAGGRVPQLTKIEFFPLAPSLSRGIPFADNII